MRKKTLSISLIILALFLFSLQGFSQCLELKSSDNGENVYEIVDRSTFRNLINSGVEQSAALRNYLAQEIQKDPDIIRVERVYKGKGLNTFSVVTKDNVSAEEVEGKLIAKISEINISLQDYLQKGMSTNELSNFIKSELLINETY